MIQLSIIVPIFNVEDFLDQCLTSVLSQDNNEIEIILVDDASTDSSRSIAGQYRDEFLHCTLLSHPQNQGLGPARNTGLEIAVGEYIMMLDSDDWLEPGSLHLILTSLKERNPQPCDILQFGCHKVHSALDGSTSRIESNLYIDSVSPAISLLEGQSHLLSLPSYAWLKVVRRELIESHNLRFTNIYYEDIPWSIALTFQAKSIRFLPEPIVNYRQRSGSIIFTQSAKHLDLLNAYQLMFKQADLAGTGRELRKSLNNAFIKAAYYLHRQRSHRLGKQHTAKFAPLYRKILTQNRIWPSTFKTLAMYLITHIKIMLKL